MNSLTIVAHKYMTLNQIYQTPSVHFVIIHSGMKTGHGTNIVPPFYWQ